MHLGLNFQKQLILTIDIIDITISKVEHVKVFEEKQN